MCWRHIGADAINICDGKTDPRTIPLDKTARVHIDAQPDPCDPDAFMFPRHAEGRGIWILTNYWQMACADAKLGKLIGHRQHRSTAG